MNKLTTLLKLASLVDDESTPNNPVAESKLEITGQHIAVLDRGFVYVGNVRREADFLIITNASNIRKWGTTKGLGQLVNGPLADTVIDIVGEVKIPFKALITLIPCSGF